MPSWLKRSLTTTGLYLQTNGTEILVPILSVVAGLLIGTIFIAGSGASVSEAYTAFFRSVVGSPPFAEPRFFGETLVQTIPLIFTGLAHAIAFRTGLFNIGAEGQYIMGSLAAAILGYAIHLPTGLHLVVALAGGALGGALYAAIPGLLKAYRGVHEVVNTIMLNWIAFYFVNWAIHLLKDPNAKTGSATPVVLETAKFVQGLIPGSRLHYGLLWAIATAIVLYIFLWRTASGYEIRAVGLSPGAAEYAGINVQWNIVKAMMISGALAGLAGAVQTLAINYRFYEQIGFTNYGFDGIAVALVGRSHPIGVLLSALLFGALGRGGPAMQAAAGIPKAVIWVVQGVIVFFVACEGLWRFLKRRKQKGASA
ncbi:MAG TPA: ABC transporter permease [Symbiobacteriaceae bacterium]|nr:ABC transporter permease [Symbiobacteriaceae bacterium]